MPQPLCHTMSEYQRWKLHRTITIMEAAPNHYHYGSCTEPLRSLTMISKKEARIGQSVGAYGIGLPIDLKNVFYVFYYICKTLVFKVFIF